MKRVKNFRTGDRAETFGVSLLKSFCSVAEVPRQEDFGLIDAVATLLREEGKFLYAEDSFLVQMKSRTEKKIEYLEARFEALKSQDLSVLVAQVDLTRSSVELHTLGGALAHPNIDDVKGLVVHLRPAGSCPVGFFNDILHVPLRKPILRWSTRDTERRAFTNKAYAVMKSLLTLERWNRRYRRTGLSQQVCWETNKVPTVGGQSYSWIPTRSQESLGELVPLVRILGSQAWRHAELRAPTVAILTWLQGRGVDADPGAAVRAMLKLGDSKERMQRALDDHPAVDVALTFCVRETRPDFLNFWLFDLNRKGAGSGHRHSGSLKALRDLGFVVEQQIVGDRATLTLGFSDAWLSEHQLEPAAPTSIVDMPGVGEGATEVFLMRKLP